VLDRALADAVARIDREGSVAMGKLQESGLITRGTEGIGFATASSSSTRAPYVFITGQAPEAARRAVKAIGDK